MKIVLMALAAAFIVACNSNKDAETSIPPKPSSIEAVKQLVKGKKYRTQKVATVSPFEMDKEKPYEWMDEMKDTSTFFKKHLADRMKFTLNFVNDTAVMMNDEEKIINGTYNLDTKTGEEEKEGIKLRISYPDSSMNFPGSTGVMIMTATYFVAGADEKSILLETPRSYNNRKVAILLHTE
ncbi:MAG: hypothetical protein WDN26_20100 [Chitinophagaceae bacterium]